MSIKVLYIPKNFYTSQNKFLATPLILTEYVEPVLHYYYFVVDKCQVHKNIKIKSLLGVRKGYEKLLVANSNSRQITQVYINRTVNKLNNVKNRERRG